MPPKVTTTKSKVPPSEEEEEGVRVYCVVPIGYRVCAKNVLLTSIARHLSGQHHIVCSPQAQHQYYVDERNRHGMRH